MKKRTIFCTALLALLLSGCSNQNNNTTNHKSEVKSSKSSTVKKSKRKESKKVPDKKVQQGFFKQNNQTKKQDNKMDLNQIQKGDYSSLIGNWHMVKAVGHHSDVTASTQSSLNITDSSISNEDITLNANGFQTKDGSHQAEFRLQGNSLAATLADADQVPVNYALYFYPAGSTNVDVDGETMAPSDKNIIVFWSSSLNYYVVYEEN